MLICNWTANLNLRYIKTKGKFHCEFSEVENTNVRVY